MTQNETNKIWNKQWQGSFPKDLNMLFTHRLFVEGLPIVKKNFEKSDRLILEVGAGTGRYSIALAAQFTEARITCTDILDSSIEIARKLQKHTGVENVVIEKADLFSLDYPDYYFDAVFSDGVIEHFKPSTKRSWQEALKEMTRVTKSGGKVIVTVPNLLNFPHTFYKMSLKLLRKKYEYGFEKSFLVRDFKKISSELGLKFESSDGYYVGYGLYRHKNKYKIFKFAGKILNRLAKILDIFTNRFFSKTFGFMIVVQMRKI